MEECRHIRVDGTKCRSAALRSQAWCYYHDDVYRRHSARFAQMQEQFAAKQDKSVTLTSPPSTESYDYGYIPAAVEQISPALQSAPTPEPLELPDIEDISSIQLAISRIVQAIAANTLDLKRAGILLYGLQIAAQNQPKTTPNVYNTVTEVGQTEDGIDVALVPPNEIAKESFPLLAARLRLNLRMLEEVEIVPEASSARAPARKSVRAR
jgi:hypothetical protein